MALSMRITGCRATNGLVCEFECLHTHNQLIAGSHKPKKPHNKRPKLRIRQLPMYRNRKRCTYKNVQTVLNSRQTSLSNQQKRLEGLPMNQPAPRMASTMWLREATVMPLHLSLSGAMVPSDATVSPQIGDAIALASLLTQGTPDHKL